MLCPQVHLRVRCAPAKSVSDSEVHLYHLYDLYKRERAEGWFWSSFCIMWLLPLSKWKITQHKNMHKSHTHTHTHLLCSSVMNNSSSTKVHCPLTAEISLNIINTTNDVTSQLACLTTHIITSRHMLCHIINYWNGLCPDVSFRIASLFFS